MSLDREIGTFSASQAREVWETTKLLRSSGLLRNLSKIEQVEPAIYPVYFRNDSGEAIPAYGCMQVDGMVVEADRAFIKVVKPDRTDGNYIFNHDRIAEDGKYGMCLPWGIVKMLGDGQSEANKSYGATVGSWSVQRQDGGPFVVYGNDVIPNVFKGRIGTTGSPAQIIQFSLSEQEDYPDDYEYGDEELCSNRDNAEPPYYGEVVKVACGASRPVHGEDYEGMVELADDLGILENRDRKQLANKTGIAVLLSDGESEYAECYWCIVYIDFHREIQVVTDIIFQENMIVVERKLIKVWDDCKLPDEEIEGIDCEEDDAYYGGGI